MKLKKSCYTICFLALFVSSLYSITGQEAIDKFRNRMFNVGTMKGDISWTYPSGTMYMGEFKYAENGKIYVKFSNPQGKLIISNGKKLWIYDEKNKICGIQDLGNRNSGGIAGLIYDYMAIAFPNSGGYKIKLKNDDKLYSEIILLVDETFLLQQAVMTTKDGKSLTISLSNVKTGEKILPSIFDFQVPTAATVVKNPLK